MNAWSTIVLVAGLLLLILLCRREWLRINPARRGLRLLASIVAVAALVCWAIPVTYRSSSSNMRTTVIVATAGADNDSIRSFSKRTNAVVLQEEMFLSAGAAPGAEVHVFGYGFTREQLEGVRHRLFFHPVPVRQGIRSAGWQRSIAKGDALHVAGMYANDAASPVKLLLMGFDTVLDSTVVPAKRTQDFSLQTIPKQHGRAVFYVAALKGKDTLQREPVPVNVYDGAPLRMLILAGAPDFENRFLQHWLSRQGYMVVNKTNTSANKYDRAVFNSDRASADALDHASLDSFDVVVSDETAVSALPAAQREAIHRQVAERGLGMIVRGDTVTGPSWYTRGFQLYTPAGKPPARTAFTVAGDERHRWRLPVEQPRFLRPAAGMQPLVQDTAGRIAGGLVGEGAGKIGWVSLSNTYSWLLSGETQAYHTFWNAMLQQASRRHTTRSSVTIRPLFAVVGERADLQIGTNDDRAPLVTQSGDTLRCAQDPASADRWSSELWPLQPGWQEPVSVDSKAHEWYVFAKEEWLSVRAGERTEATREYAAGNPQKRSRAQEARDIAGKETAGADRRQVNPAWFFALFLVSCAFLWAERKVS